MATAKIRNEVKFFGKMRCYPDGSYDLVGSEEPVFSQKGYETGDRGKISQEKRRLPVLTWARAVKLGINPASVEGQRLGVEACPSPAPRKAAEPSPENVHRAQTRARASVRQLALANDFKWFVTLTLDPAKVDSKDPAEVVKKLSQWCSNQVTRRGLRYILVPERHKKGGIHFHGFFNDCLRAVDSGHKDRKGHPVYNLPGWTLGFTTAIELYDDYHSAVGYVCKYIGKGSEKIGGRWYYSGGDLHKPVEKYVDMSAQEIVENFPDAWVIQTPGGLFAGVNGVKGDTKKDGIDNENTVCGVRIEPEAPRNEHGMLCDQLGNDDGGQAPVDNKRTLSTGCTALWGEPDQCGTEHEIRNRSGGL